MAEKKDVKTPHLIVGRSRIRKEFEGSRCGGGESPKRTRRTHKVKMLHKKSVKEGGGVQNNDETLTLF